jgi:nucleotide-binding universal stress UspA family protein
MRWPRSRKRGSHRSAVWRYDPILLTTLTPADWHIENFARLAKALANSVDEATVSFATIYRKTARNLSAAAKTAGFDWWDPPEDEQKALVADLAAIADGHGMKLTVCSQPQLEQAGTTGAACIDARRLSLVAGYDIRAKRKGNRPGCLCAESRDIGAYDTCAHGCVYCYAVSDHDRAQQAIREVDPCAPMLKT